MKNVLVTGATGLVGSALCKELTSAGYNVRKLVRTPSGGENEFLWDVDSHSIDVNALKDCHAIIHLAGENISNGRWTKKRKEKLYNSRVLASRLLFDKCRESGNFPKIFISASGVSYYGVKTDEKIFSENDRPGSDFLADLTSDWEVAAERFSAEGCRVCTVRTSFVLSKKGGGLEKLKNVSRFGLLSPVGNGQQWMPWIHIDDLVGIYMFLLDAKECRGPYNAASPEHATNRSLLKELASLMKKPFFFPPVPAFMMKMLFGKGLGGVLLYGSRISSEKIRKAGYDFKLPALSEALKDSV